VLAAASLSVLVLPCLAILGSPVSAAPGAAAVAMALPPLFFAATLRFLRPMPPALLGASMVAVTAWVLSQASYSGVAWVLAAPAGVGAAFISPAESRGREGVLVAGLAAAGVTLTRFTVGRESAMTAGAAIAITAAILETLRHVRAPLKLRSLVYGGAAGLATLVLTAYAGATTPRAAWFGSLVAHGPRDQRFVALTFDDGPNPPYTEAISEILAAHGTTATFFLVGKALDASPDTARDLIQAGNLLGNHSYHHDAFRWLDPRYPELADTQAAFKRDLGVCPAFFRPPHGTHTPLMSRAAAEDGVTVVTWDVSAADWATADPALVAKRVLDRISPGSIILLHDGIDGNIGANRTVILQALPTILDGLKARGLEPVTLDKLLHKPGYLSTC
jgi:peptidoglycan/xylan/chitin deacetylase (PgdA/CDA1 family)